MDLVLPNQYVGKKVMSVMYSVAKNKTKLVHDGDCGMFPFSFLTKNSHLGVTEIVSARTTSFSVVQTNELEAPEHFIQPESFVLTVGAAFRDRAEELPTYIAHLAEQGAVAVGFGISDVFDTVPQPVIDSARKHNIGLYEVSRPVPFSRIVSAVYEEQHRRSTAEQHQRAYAQQQLLRAQEKLTRTAISGDMKALTRDVAESLEARVAISDANGRTIAEQVARSYNAMKKTYATTYKISSETQQPYTVDVTSTRVITGENRSLIRHYAGLAAALLSRPAQLRRVHNQINSYALRIQLGIKDAEELYADSVDAPVDADGFARPIVIATQSRRAMHTVLGTLDRQAHKRDQLLHALHLTETAFLLVVRPEVNVRNVLDDLGEHRSRVRVAAGSPVVLAGLTPEHVDQLEARTRTLRPGDVSYTNDSTLPWLHEPAVTQALAARREEIFGRLARHDATHGTDLEKTLAVFLRHSAQLANTADALGVHRHTVRTRIEKIQNLCEISLDNPAHFSEAYLAMTAFDG